MVHLRIRSALDLATYTVLVSSFATLAFQIVNAVYTLSV